MVVQSGVDWMEINSTLKEKGISLFFPVCFSLLPLHATTNSKDRLIPAPLPRLVVCSAQGVPEVGFPSSYTVDYLIPPLSKRRSIRYRERRVVLERGSYLSRKSRRSYR